jgi:hypothetical protein
MKSSTANAAEAAAAQNDSAAAPVPTETARKPDPREALDPLKQVEVMALLTLGFSRRAAARQVGCSHSSIARAVARDPHFANQLVDAEMRADVNALKIVKSAAQQEKYWRAAAWILERRLPDDFGPPRPNVFSGDQVMALLSEVFSYALPALRDDKKDEFMRAFNETLQDVEAKVRQGDRWRDMADGSGAAEAAADPGNLRSPYEHPQWYDPERPHAIAEKPAPTDPAVQSPAEINGAPPMRKPDVCQFSQKRGSIPKWVKECNPFLYKRLQQLPESVPVEEDPRGGPHLGPPPVHLGNGHA